MKQQILNSSLSSTLKKATSFIVYASLYSLSRPSQFNSQ